MSSGEYRILVTGSRHRTDDEIVHALEHAVGEANKRGCCPVTVIHGDAPGADATADAWANESDYILVEAHPADWSKGKAEGPARNQRMVDAGADICLAFPATDSKGTWDCIRRAVAAGIETRIYPEPR